MNRTDNRSAFFAHEALAATSAAQKKTPSYSGFVMPKQAPKPATLFARLLALI